jgi:hypothetical protein
MSIKTIGTSVESNTAGIKKRINKAAEELVFDILQSTQYSTPIASTVRELVTNACDSQREKEIALEILRGEKKVEDYYITRHEDKYIDSNFDPDYYDENCLNEEENRVIVKYEEKDGAGFCDVFSVLDRGVGIGQKRLEGYLELGFSTKRNTAENFGAFGLGAKVPLSTGVDFYTVDTVHNGRRFHLNCFAYKTDDLTSKWEADGHITFSDGRKVYYTHSDAANGTCISFGVKRHNRSKFVDAVQDQLCYLPNVKFEYKYQDSDYVSDRTMTNEILYNSDNLIVGKSWGWSRPHILLVKSPGATTGINYGYVDFRELEMEDLWGAVAIKCPARQVYKDPDTGEEVLIQDGVDVTPSREKVIWNDNTKKFIQGAIERAAQDAAKAIEDTLDEDDYMTWIRKCRDVLYKGDDANSVLTHLGRIVDKEKISPRFPKNKLIQYGGPGVIMRGFKVRNVRKVFKDGKHKIGREEVGWGEVNFNNLYFVEGNPSKVKDLYLSSDETLTLITEHHVDNPTGSENIQKAIDAININRIRNWDLIKDSSVIKWNYDDIEVPSSFEDSLELQEKLGLATQKYYHMTPEERRAVAGHDVFFTLRRPHTQAEGHSLGPDAWVWDKVEGPIDNVKNPPVDTYYGTSDDEALLKFAAYLSAPSVTSWDSVFPFANTYEFSYRNNMHGVHSNPCFSTLLPVRFRKWDGRWPEKMGPGEEQKQTDLQLFRVSRKMGKMLEGSGARHISEFFSVESNNTWTMHDKVKRWFTGCMLPYVPEWVKELKHIDPRYEDVYNRFREYDRFRHMDHRGLNLSVQSDEVKQLVELMNKMHQMQLLVNQTDDIDQIRAKSAELFRVSDVEATIFDEEMLTLGQYMEDYLEPLRPLFDRVQWFVNDHLFWKEITNYLSYKDRADFNPPL